MKQLFTINDKIIVEPTKLIAYYNNSQLQGELKTQHTATAFFNRLPMLKFQLHSIILLLIVELTIQSFLISSAPLLLEPFQLDEILNGVYSTKTFNGTWVKGNLLVYRDNDNNVNSFDPETKAIEQIIDKTIFDNYPDATLTFSNDLQYVALRYNVSQVFRHSTTASFTIYDLTNRTFYDVAGKNPVQLFQWSPSGHRSVYIRENNIHFLENPATDPVSVTNNGVPGIIYNGVPDWVYEEEVLASGSAIWFSPDSNKLAFAQFNDTKVEEFDYVHYGEPNELLYPEIRTIRYPKVNTTNPTVRTFWVDLSNPTITTTNEIQGIPTRFLSDAVFYGMTWPNNNEIVILSTNRVQNQAELIRCDLNNNCQQESTYFQENGWLDPTLPVYNRNGTIRYEISPQPVDDDDTYSHLIKTTVERKKATRLTFNRFVVSSILGYDEDNDVIYFEGSGIDAFSQNHVYAHKNNATTCLTCNLTTSAGQCLYASGVFSPDLQYFVRVCQGPGPHLVEIVRLKDSTSSLWEDNSELVAALLTKKLPLKRDLKVPVDGGFHANVRLLLPYDFDENLKYPAIVNVYGGPDSNQIKDSYTSAFADYIVSNRQYIYVYIDGRGSGRDGNNKKFQIYHKMATVEIEDQIAVTKYLQQNLPFIDATRTAIWGWSYGGFATLWTLVKDVEHVFCFGLAVAPVTNFRLYDSIYTERYMGLDTEDDNSLGYNNTDLFRNVEAFRGRQFMVIHGNGDDNVHYQQSMLLARALEEADILFRQQSYPDENHSLLGVSPHLYHTIDRFWARSFGLPDLPTGPQLTY